VTPHIAAEVRAINRGFRAFRAGIKNAELARRLTEMGLPETEASVQVKINRGAFPAWFLFAAMRAIGVDTLRLAQQRSLSLELLASPLEA